MNILKKYSLLLFLCLATFVGKSQVVAPDFLCVKGDSLFWIPATNTCGPFQAYTIYFSTTKGGPYSVLVAINDPGQTNFRHTNPTGQEWFYYLESNHNCPGEVVLQSDTLNNRSPEISPIESATVVGEDVLLTWTPSPSPEVFAHVIYRATSTGTVPIDTVFTPLNTYLDINANPLSQSEAYFVTAIDPCGNNSIFDVPHFTTLLNYTVNPCLQNITLSWNKYDSWPNGINRQEVWLSFDSGPAELVATLNADTTSYIFENALKGHLYSFYIQSYEANGTYTAASNTAEVEPQVIQAIRELNLKNVSVTTDNEVRLNWIWNTDAEIDDIAYLGSSENNNYTILANQNPFSPLQFENFYTEQTINPSEEKKYFRLETTDLCDSTFRSNYGSTIFLSGNPREDFHNFLQWTPYDLEGGVVESYEVYRIVEGRESLVETIVDSSNSFADLVDPANNAESNVCYYIVANAVYELPDGSLQNLRSRSNQICVQQISNIFAPNAFVPSGVNTRFKPVVVFSENVSYRMLILDRWGGKVFETTNLDEGWTGRKGLRLLPGGAYTYIIRVVQPDGMMVEKKGIVVMIR